MKRELSRIEDLGCIKKVNVQPHIVLPLSVVYSTKWRLVVDASRHLNPYLFKRTVKLDTLPKANQGVIKNSYASIQDLDGGYWHCGLHPDMQKYVGVHLRDPETGVVQFYVWLTLFLGISDAVWLFTKLLKPHQKYLRKRGVNTSIFIDDQRVVSSSKSKCIRDTNLARVTWARAGWIEKAAKCQNEPKQVVRFLGLLNDYNTLQYFIPTEKKEGIIKLVNQVSQARSCTARHLAKIVGKLNALSLAIGPIVRLMCRSSYVVISTARDWDDVVQLSSECIDHLFFLSSNLDSLEGQSFHFLECQTPITCFISDASASGTFSYKINCGSNHFSDVCDLSCIDKDSFLKIAFDDDEKAKSSTVREMLALLHLYSAKGLSLKNCTVHHYTDSYNCMKIMQIGSKRPHLQALAMKIFQICKKFNINLKISWLSRSSTLISLADVGSKSIDEQNYGIDQWNFDFLYNLFGPFTIDLFASIHNRRVLRFYSLLHTVHSLGTNAFSFDWSGENCWVSPSPKIVIPVIRHIIATSAFGVLLVPFWPSAHFFHSLSSNGSHYNKLFVCVVKFKPAYVKGAEVHSSTFSGVPLFSSLALQFDGSIIDPYEPNLSLCVDYE